MATTPLRFSSVIVVARWTQSIYLLLEPLENASEPLGPSRGKVSLHFEHLETPVP
jgi:hypothetical protein